MRWFFTILCVIWAGTAVAQSTEDDRDFITGLIEDSISNEDMVVRLINFQGALSSEATADAITIADSDGIWLQLDGLTIQWNRSALLSGRVEVDALTADRIELIRLPTPANDPALPSAEATPFTLPELPVSVEIKDVSADEIVLTEALLGEPITARFEGAVSLIDGAANTNILLERTDQKQGRFDIDASYTEVSRQLALFLLAEEGQNGIAARLLNLPDRPAVRLEVSGDAPLDDFMGDIALATDDIDRITGTVRLSRPSGTIDQAFALDLTGDLRPMLASQYDTFFGENTVLKVEGTSFGLGGLRLSNLIVGADQLVLRGSAAFDAQGWPEAIDLRGQLGSGGANRVLLPIGGTPTEVSGMSLNVQYDAADGDAWTGAFDVTSLGRDGLSMDAVAISGGGIIVPGAGGSQGRFSADLNYAARGLGLDDPALSQAIGRNIEGTIGFGRVEEEPFIVRDFTLNGAGLMAQGNAVIQGPDGRFQTTAELTIDAEDFTRFAALTGLDLTGSGLVRMRGELQPFDGIFDVFLAARTTDLALGIAQIDPVLAGDAVVSLRVDRDTTGTRLRRVRLASGAVIAEGSGQIVGQTAQATFNAELNNLNILAPSLSGPAILNADVETDPQGNVTLTTELSAPNATATVQGVASPLEGGYVLRGDGAINIDELRAYSDLVGQQIGGGVSVDLDGTFTTTTGVMDADVTARTRDLQAGGVAINRILAGLGRMSANVSLSQAGRLRLDALDVVFPNLTASGAVATSGNDTTANLSVRLRDVALLVSDFSGPLVADVSARQDAAGWQVSGEANGPVQTVARATGRVSNSGELDMSVTGSVPLALANLYIAPRQVRGLANFDLSVQGPPALNSIRGPIRISDARLSAPTLQQSLEDISGTITMAGGTARIDVAAASTAGGNLTLSGPVDLNPPFRGDLTVAINDIVLRDPTLYRAAARGQVVVSGPLAGGASITGNIDLRDVEVQVPSTGVSALGSLPAVTHLGIPTRVAETLARADVGISPSASGEAAAAGPAYPIDLNVRAPSRIFVRGRGLDAELGGQLRLTGTTNDIVPIGRFDLVRGRLSILGQRFDLDEGYAQLQGDFIPFLRLVATSETRTGTVVSIIVEGPADDIEVRFESSPELPQDEVLAQLLFGRDLSSISPLQAVQLASAVATLAGSGDGGVVNRLREGLDLDDLDFVTDDDGNAAVRAGKYISDRVYTDITVGTSGTSEINLNIDIDRNFTARGSVASDGETSVGIFFERDY
ncbi:translocation/assembly module TamB domain-containing protein [Octadecabacter sp. G9-8]|uniref:Translocation/assembly module TamB domain-containing protein n=1 Tax=Octadecabacter dasysiphoniae TaxID=2909341 RepID=A0ABS9CYQ1_9RHOB|nr:translocation/assembly module TamB domain-containing protein [Octadecabacter dasysiphoniae]MCF2872397.1 translocation/assembly module TamB domain-containing protein [Octadecabacter dasysiphoniae]